MMLNLICAPTCSQCTLVSIAWWLRMLKAWARENDMKKPDTSTSFLQNIQSLNGWSFHSSMVNIEHYLEICKNHCFVLVFIYHVHISEPKRRAIALIRTPWHAGESSKNNRDMLSFPKIRVEILKKSTIGSKRTKNCTNFCSGSLDPKSCPLRREIKLTCYRILIAYCTSSVYILAYCTCASLGVCRWQTFF